MALNPRRRIFLNFAKKLHLIMLIQAFSQIGIQASCGWPLVEQKHLIFPMPFLEANRKTCGKIGRLVNQPQTLELRQMSTFCTWFAWICGQDHGHVKIISSCAVDEFVWEAILSSPDYIRMSNNDIKHREFLEEKLHGQASCFPSLIFHWVFADELSAIHILTRKLPSYKADCF